MVGAIRKYRVDSGKVLTVLQQIQEDLIPLVRRTPGFAGFFVVNQEDTIVTVNFAIDPRRLQDADATASNWMKTLGSSIVLLSQEVAIGPVAVEAWAE